MSIESETLTNAFLNGKNNNSENQIEYPGFEENFENENAINNKALDGKLQTFISKSHQWVTPVLEIPSGFLKMSSLTIVMKE